MWRKYGDGKAIFSFIFFLACLGVLGYGAIVPMWTKAADLQTQSDEWQAKLREVQTFLVDHPDLPTYEVSIKKQLRQADKCLPDTLALSAVLQQIEQASAGCGIQIIALEPQTRADQPQRQEIPLRLKVAGDYQQLLAFIRTVEGMASFNRVEIVKIKSDHAALQSELIVRYFVFQSADQGV